jgi:transcriptional regulator with XRE-family HTH domain
LRPIDEQLSRPGGLAERLYMLRKGAGIPVGELAVRLGWQPSKVTKLQRGQQRPTVADIEKWANACGQPGAASELLDLLSEADAVHWRWQRRLANRKHASTQEDLGRAERQAQRYRSVQIAVVPGVLQTADYARHMVTMFHKLQNIGLEDVEASVTARIRRQDILDDPDRMFEFVMTENVLRRRVGGAEVMSRQLNRLIRLSELANITLAILPDRAEDLEIFPYQAFLMLDERVIIDGASAEDRLTPEEVAVYERMYDASFAASATGDQARALIAAAAEALR